MRPRSETVLHVAIKNNFSEIVALLLESASQLALKETLDGNFPIIYALRIENTEMFAKILQYSPDIKDPVNYPRHHPMVIAAANGNTAALKLMLQAGARHSQTQKILAPKKKYLMKFQSRDAIDADTPDTAVARVSKKKRRK